MPILRRDDSVQTTQGQAVPGAAVYYLTQPANTTTFTPLANVYSDISGTPADNPQITDGFGHAVAYLDNSQLYTIVWVSPFIGKIVYTDQNVGNAVSSLTPILIGASDIQGDVNGTNAVFTLDFVSSPQILLVWQNSAFLIPGVGFTYTQAAGVITITFTNPPFEGDVLSALILS